MDLTADDLGDEYRLDEAEFAARLSEELGIADIVPQIPLTHRCLEPGCESARWNKRLRMCRQHYDGARHTRIATKHCSVGACSNAMFCKGMCQKHYATDLHVRKTRMEEPQKAKRKDCSVDECARPSITRKQLCRYHYQVQYRLDAVSKNSHRLHRHNGRGARLLSVEEARKLFRHL